MARVSDNQEHLLVLLYWFRNLRKRKEKANKFSRPIIRRFKPIQPTSLTNKWETTSKQISSRIPKITTISKWKRQMKERDLGSWTAVIQSMLDELFMKKRWEKSSTIKTSGNSKINTLSLRFFQGIIRKSNEQGIEEKQETAILKPRSLKKE